MFNRTDRKQLPAHRLTALILALAWAILSAMAVGCTTPTATSTTSPATTAATTQPAVPTPSPTPTVTETTAAPTPTTPPVLNPLTGLPLANSTAEGQRPVAIMINNHKKAVPQIGVGSADIIYEMLVEGGITRLMAVFADVTAIPELGSIRSARHDYIDLCGGLDAIYVHIGASNLANDQFKRQGTAHIDLHVFPDSYWRDPAWREDRGYEHSVKTTGEMLQAAIIKSGYRTEVRNGIGSAFSFRAYGTFEPAAGATAVSVTIPYSDYCTATFKYNDTTKLYSKGQFGADHIDLATGEPLQFTNVFVLQTQVVVCDDIGHKDADLKAGKGYYITGGTWQSITWTKGETNDSFVFRDADDQVLAVNPGKSYVGIAPTSKIIKIS